MPVGDIFDVENEYPEEVEAPPQQEEVTYEPYQETEPPRAELARAMPADEVQYLPYDEAEAAKEISYQPYTEPESGPMTALREFGHGVAPAVAAAGTGMLTGGALGTPLGLPGMIGGALIGGVAGGYAAETAQDKAAKALGFDDDAARVANREEHPYWAAAGSALSNLAGFGPGLVRGGISAATRAFSALISGAGETGVKLYEGKRPEETAWQAAQRAAPDIIAQTVMGGVAPNPYRWGTRLEEAGAQFAGRFGRTAPDVAPAARPAEQGQFPWGAERQPELPLGEPAARPVEPTGRERQGELPLEPEATINREGQYGFTVRNPMPDTGGASKSLAAPPVGEEPHSSVRYGKEAAEQRGVSSESGINVLQPGQTEPSLNYGLRHREGEAAATRAGEAQAPEPPPGPATRRLEAEFPTRPGVQAEPLVTTPFVPRAERGPQAPRMAEGTQGVMTEPPVPRGMHRLYQGAGMPRGQFTTDLERAQQFGRVRYTDVTGEQAQHFRQGRLPNEFLTDNPLYRQRSQPLAGMPLEPVRPRVAPTRQRVAPAAPAAVTPPRAPPPAAPAARPARPERPAARAARADPMALQRANYDAIRQAAPNLSEERAVSISRMAGSPKQAELMAQNAARREAAGEAPRRTVDVGEQLKAEEAARRETVGDTVKARASEARKELADASGPKINQLYEAARAENSALNKEMIDAGRGSEKPNETRTKTDDLSQRVNAASDRQQAIVDELRRRERFHGGVNPIPKTHRYSYQAMGRDVRREPVERGRSGRPTRTRELPIGTEEAILERGYERATGPRGEPREPGLQAAERQGPLRSVTTHDGAVFTGKDQAEAAAHARAAGYRPHQIFDAQGRVYEPPKAAAAPKEAPAAAPEAAAAPSGRPEKPVPPSVSELMPATKHDLAEGLVASVRRMLMPRLSPSANIAATAIREAKGPLRALREQIAARFDTKMHRIMNAMDEDGFRRFVGAIESRRIDTLPAEQQPIAQRMRQGFDDVLKEIQALPQTEQMKVVEGYFPHMWKNKDAAARFLQDYYSPRGGSLKKRGFPTYEDGIRAGLEPISANPMEYLVRYTNAMTEFLSQRRMLNDLDSQKAISWHAPRSVGATGSPEAFMKDAPPVGYAKIELPWAVKQRGPVAHEAYAPKDMAQTINNFYSAGLRRNAESANVVDFLQRTKNMWTGLELGISVYHAFTEIHEAMASGIARSLILASGRQYAGALKQLITAPLEAVTAPLRGREGLKMYRGLATGTAVEQRMMEAIKKANIAPGDLSKTGEYDYARKHLRDFVTAWKRGSLWNEFKADLKHITEDGWMKGILRGAAFPVEQVARLMQTISAPLFQHYIPLLKLGSLMKDMEAFIKVKPNATDKELAEAARRFADSVDNRMGEMNKDNLFMNKTIKDVGFLSLRSFAWTLGGPIREITGGAASGLRGALKGENRLNPNSKNFDPRAAYAIAFPASVAAISAVYQYLRAGKGPEDWRDLVTPQTGGIVKSVGQNVPERALLPGYHKDFLGYMYHPGRELYAKLAVPWQTLYEQIANKKWNDKAIVPPEATLGEQLKYRGAELGERLKPIGVKTMSEPPRKGSAITPFERGLGFRPAGAHMLNPERLHKYLTDKEQREWTAQEKQINRDRQLRGLEPLPPRRLPRKETAQ